jgi:tryptophan-rich sensory protein
MAGLDAFEATTLFFFLVAWWTNPFDTNGTSSKVMRKRYRNLKGHIKFIPGWLFGPIWFILYSMVAVAMWLYFNYASTEKHEDHHHYYDAILGLMLVHYVLNKLWTTLFFTLQNYWLGAIDAVLIFLTGATLGVLVWIHNDGDNQGSIHAAGGLMIPYVLWTLYATILSIDIAISNRSEFFSRPVSTRIDTAVYDDLSVDEEMQRLPMTDAVAYVDEQGKLAHRTPARARVPTEQRRRRGKSRAAARKARERSERRRAGVTSNGW